MCESSLPLLVGVCRVGLCRQWACLLLKLSFVWLKVLLMLLRPACSWALQ